MTGERLEVAGCVHLLGRPALKVSREVQQPLGFPSGSVGKESACNAGDPGSIPGWGKISLQKGTATHSSIAWRIPVGREEPGGLQSVGSQSGT